MDNSNQCMKQIDDLLNLPNQIWFLGAGASCKSGIPLMGPLTDRIGHLLDEQHQKDFATIRSLLPETSHVEHVLSHIGDMLSIARRLENKEVQLGQENRSIADLMKLHKEIQKGIRDTIRWGYVPENDGKPEQIGTLKDPIVKIDLHLEFINALFNIRRKGFERRPPISFFTTNYDTLLEDALSLSRIHCEDGFIGGSMAFWRPNFYSNNTSHNINVQATVHKIHGSIDWFWSEKDIVVRLREGAGYPTDPDRRLLIYPQSTKYEMTQKDPFASLFSSFRNELSNINPSMLAICGYSFGDDHINEEIERSMRKRDNKLTILIFVRQDPNLLEDEHRGLPLILSKWLADESETWTQRLIIAGSHGVFHGSLENKSPRNPDNPFSWWSFKGVTQLLEFGPEVAQ
jgi:hypothetical protein